MWFDLISCYFFSNIEYISLNKNNVRYCKIIKKKSNKFGNEIHDTQTWNFCVFYKEGITNLKVILVECTSSTWRIHEIKYRRRHYSITFDKIEITTCALARLGRPFKIIFRNVPGVLKKVPCVCGWFECYHSCFNKNAKTTWFNILIC